MKAVRIGTRRLIRQARGSRLMRVFESAGADSVLLKASVGEGVG